MFYVRHFSMYEDKCSPLGINICQNGGSCFVENFEDANPICSCPEQYSGVHCETGNYSTSTVLHKYDINDSINYILQIFREVQAGWCRCL